MLNFSAKAFVPTSLHNKYRDWQYDRALPDRARQEQINDCRRALPNDPGIAAAVTASLQWLKRAQDCSKSADGGVARHFSLRTGWAESYPETTGYIIPTFLECGFALNSDELVARARRMLDWCVSIQLPSGAFSAGTISAQPQVPTTFNTGQILIGLAAGARAFEEERYVRAMHRAASWLRDSQDEDGCWRKFPTPFAKAGEKTYETHASWGLFEVARLAPNSGYGEAGLKQVSWALSKQQDNGWFADCCLDDPARPLTHTIGYALRGVLEAYRYSGQRSFLKAACRTGHALLEALTSTGQLSGRFRSDWSAAVDWICLTGTAQIADCWLMLFEFTGDWRFQDGARKANSFVRRLVRTHDHPDVLGGVKGSFPVGGAYGRYEYLNWAAKFFIDANRREARLNI